MEQKIKSQKHWLLVACLAGALLYEGYMLNKVSSEQQTLSETVASTTSTLRYYTSDTSETVSGMQQKLLELSDALYENQQLTEDLNDTVKNYTKQVSKLTDNVETLEKITTTDAELLQKYSLVYFLNEHYKPADLTVVDEKYDVDEREVSIDSNVWPFLKKLLENAADDGISLLILSGYRSFDEQGTIKGIYTVQYGTGANKFSADQGYSEHQLGTTVDITTPEGGQNLDAFKGTEALKWLEDNAYKYGFIMSYPENNEYYVYEPWHWRFVGRDLARYIHKEDTHFYDLEQRTIDSYIGTIFD